MKNFLFITTIVIILQSCGTSSNVTSNFSIQKRKYNKGWNVKDLFQYKQSMNDSKESDVIIVPNENHPVSENKAETKTNDETFSTHSSNKEIIVDKEIENEAKIFNDQKAPTLKEHVLIQQTEIETPIVKDEDPKESEISPELKRFNKYHKIMEVLLICAIFTLLTSLVPLYVLLIIQRFRNAKVVPNEERNEDYYKKKQFADVFFILGTLLLIISAIVIAILLISIM